MRRLSLEVSLASSDQYMNSSNNFGLKKSKSICNVPGCSKKARACIQICGRTKKDDTILYLCRSCARMFADPLCDCPQCNSDKKMLEPTLGECSNINSVLSVYQ